MASDDKFRDELEKTDLTIDELIATVEQKIAEDDAEDQEFKAEIAHLQALVRRQPLRQKRMSFAGAFKLPTDLGDGSDAQWGGCFTHRRVGNEVRCFGASHNPVSLYECAVPTLSTDIDNLPTAPLVRNWGPCVPGYQLYGLKWDEQLQKLLASWGDPYNASDWNAVSLTAVDLRETGAVTAGSWRFLNRSCKMTQGGIIDIPAWFATAHGVGRLAAGCGGYFSVAGMGPASMGPSFTAFDRAALVSDDPIPNRPLVGYPFGGTTRCHRNPNYRSEFDGGAWNPANGIGFWAWTDWLFQGASWADTPTVSGLIVFPTLGQGRVWYETSTLHAEAGSHAAMVYDPADLAKVLSGELAQDQIQPAAQWAMEFPGIAYPLGGWADHQGTMVTGVDFDPVDARLYVRVRFPRWTPQGPNPSFVYVYRVQ